MNDFTASNGVHVTHTASGTLIMHDGDVSTFGETVDRVDVEALREFFQAEADERIGRWRWPENTDYVVYPVGDDVVDVLRESSVSESTRGPGRQASITRADAAAWDSEASQNFYRAARAHFDAHPDPKPWHDAQPGEVWVLETRSDLGTDKRAWHITDRPESFWALSQGYLLVKSKSIVSGYRIWPEVAS